MKSIVLLLLSLFLIAQCAEPESQSPPVEPPPQGPVDPGNSSGEKLTLYLFSAPWCESCNQELPEVNRILRGQIRSVLDRLSVQVHVVSGKTPAQPATQKVADEYKASLGFSYDFIADRFCKFYRKFYDAANCEIPAAVVTRQNGDVLRAFTPGRFTPVELTDFIKENLK